MVGSGLFIDSIGRRRKQRSGLLPIVQATLRPTRDSVPRLARAIQTLNFSKHSSISEDGADSVEPHRSSIRSHHTFHPPLFDPANVTLLARLRLLVVPIRVYIPSSATTSTTMAISTLYGHGHAPTQETFSDVPLQRRRETASRRRHWHEERTLRSLWRHEPDRSTNRRSDHLTVSS